MLESMDGAAMPQGGGSLVLRCVAEVVTRGKE